MKRKHVYLTNNVTRIEWTTYNKQYIIYKLRNLRIQQLFSIKIVSENGIPYYVYL